MFCILRKVKTKGLEIDVDDLSELKWNQKYKFRIVLINDIKAIN